MPNSSIFPIVLNQRATYILPIVFLQDDGLTPVDLSGYTAKAQFRQTFDAPDPALISVSTEDGNIIISGTTGSITLTIPSSLTDLATGLQLVYDLFIYSPTGIATRLLYGNSWVEGSVTQ